MRLQEKKKKKTATEEKLEERMERWMELSELAEEIEKNRQEMACGFVKHMLLPP